MEGNMPDNTKNNFEKMMDDLTGMEIGKPVVCLTCGKRQLVASYDGYLLPGWPRCCGVMMMPIREKKKLPHG